MRRVAGLILAVTFALLTCAVASAQVHRATYPDEAKDRAEGAVERLSKTDAGKILLKSIEAHGGIEKWFAGKAIRFHYAYRPVEGPAKVGTQTVDLLGSRAYVDMEEPECRVGYLGERVWTTMAPKDFPARFWALTPYYFTAVPFVFGDPGVKLAMFDEPDEASGLGATYKVKVTYEAGTGDAPDDYYVAYIDKKTNLLTGLKYVVSYKPFMKGEMKHTPEKLVVYSDFEPAGPLTIARTHTTYATNEDGSRGELRTNSKVSDFQYGVEFDESKLQMPEKAMYDEALGPVEE
ncbi:hypothetical protein KDL45_07020 [bacterium]|nr:hypothetical protein [bacterium]